MLLIINFIGTFIHLIYNLFMYVLLLISLAYSQKEECNIISTIEKYFFPVGVGQFKQRHTFKLNFISKVYQSASTLGYSPTSASRATRSTHSIASNPTRASTLRRPLKSKYITLRGYYRQQKRHTLL